MSLGAHVALYKGDYLSFNRKMCVVQGTNIKCIIHTVLVKPAVGVVLISLLTKCCSNLAVFQLGGSFVFRILDNLIGFAPKHIQLMCVVSPVLECHLVLTSRPCQNLIGGEHDTNILYQFRL